MSYETQKESNARYLKTEKGKAAKFRAYTKYQSTPEFKSRRASEYLGRQYGLSRGDRDAMLLAQGGKCAICGEPEGERKLHIDHNHETGKVRALLCQRCNVSLGRVEKVGAQKFVDYLDRYDGNQD